MMNITPELLSRYADGECGSEERAAVAAAILKDAQVAAQLDEFLELNGLFGLETLPESVSAEPVTPALAQRLYDLRPVKPLAEFEPVVQAPGPTGWRAWGWPNWAAAAAAILMIVVGFRALTHKSPVTLHDFARLALSSTGDVAGTQHVVSVQKRAGDVLAASATERVSFRLADGSMVVLLPNSRVSLGEPNPRGDEPRELFAVESGTVLCTAQDSEDPVVVHAGGYVLHTRGASFGVRVDPSVKAMGASGRAARVAVAVRRGALSVVNGATTTLREYERVVMEDGRAVERGHASADPCYRELMNVLSNGLSREIMPGYFASERGVSVVAAGKWERARGGVRTLAVTDDGRGAARAKFLVLHVRASKPTPLTLSFVRPSVDRAGHADVATVTTSVVGTEWQVVAIPRATLARDDAVRSTRAISAGRSRLVRFELASADPAISFELKSTLWAERGPMGTKTTDNASGIQSDGTKTASTADVPHTEEKR